MLALALREFTLSASSGALPSDNACLCPITCKLRHCLHSVTGPAFNPATSNDCAAIGAVQGLAADMVQACTADAATADAITATDATTEDAAPAAAGDATTADAAAADNAAPESAAATESTRAARSVDSIQANLGGRPDEQSDVKLSTAEVSVSEATTPAGSASGVKEASTSRKSGSKTWFGKAGGILGRWTVPVKVKKEPNSRPQGVTETIDLT